MTAPPPQAQYGYSVEVPEGYDEAVVRARLAFKGEGFSILSEMHVGGMLGPETGSARQYLVMGAWTAPVSERDLGADLGAGVHLPCNLVVHETASGAIVAALDPAEGVTGLDPAAAAGAEAAREALGRVLEKVGSGSG